MGKNQVGIKMIKSGNLHYFSIKSYVVDVYYNRPADPSTTYDLTIKIKTLVYSENFMSTETLEDNFPWCLIVHWDPLNAKQSCPQKCLIRALYKCMVSMATLYMILKNRSRPTKSIISRVLLILER